MHPGAAGARRGRGGRLSAAADLDARLAALTLRDEHRLRRRARLARDQQQLERVDHEIVRAEALVQRRRDAVPAIGYPEELPVSQHRDELLATLRDHQVVVVAGETGSGKTTQLPKLLLELGRGVRGAIAHTQPRRLAARTVAQRIADELGVPLGEAVGYAVRFTDRTRDDTLVQLMTDGLLLAQVQHDRLLRRYDTIVVDEAHERSLNIDFLLGYLKQLLPRRPDLKVVLTSATIDPERFAAHFGDAPIVEVSGRTYPVEVRWRPAPEDDPPDQPEQIADAVEELLRDGPPGDILVFLSGEREIRDTAEVLTGRFADRGLDVLPLYARLSNAEQQRVFQPHAGRRVVLATNVAETSLTVPGITSVIDPGTARISRYSARLKVQRLPIEAVSQASANQRAGRCGRVAPGVCIRLYSEEDYAERPEFTDPEVLRTNLASVILQMAALGLGEIEDFPFLDPPDRRQVRDGVLLLQELGALDDDRALTETGRRLTRLPLDPRLGRMVLEADARRCVDEVVIIAAGLTIQDPRERPSDQRQAADEQHRRFADERSDFLTYLNLWRYLDEQQRALSGSQFRKQCRREFLHYLRIREWQDLVGQLRSAVKRLDITPSDQPAEPDDVHRALLAGLLSHLGVRDAAKRDYLGARGARFVLWPGSALARQPPPWIVVAELVETSRLFGREGARIDPKWVEPIAGHLVKRAYDDPRWDRRRGSAVATERVTLYGLPVVAGRTVPLGRIEPELAREVFLRKALVERDWDTPHAFFAENGRRLEEVAALEERLRRRDVLADDATLYAFFDERVPARVKSARDFDRWWKDARRTDPDLLTYPRELLVAAQADDGGRPATWTTSDGVELALSYRFEPGSERDGVTVHVPLRLAGRLDAEPFRWLVPALRLELVTTLLRGLPKELRRPLVPVPETAEKLLARLDPARGTLPEELSRELAALHIAPGHWDFAALPSHLRMRFRIEDARGAVVAEGEDLPALQRTVRPLLQRELTAAAASLQRSGLTGWADIGTLPKAVGLPGTEGKVRAFPALVDEGGTVGVRVFPTREEQAQAMRAGTRRLLLLTVPNPARQVRGALGRNAQLTLGAAPHGSLTAVLDDALHATVDGLVEAAGGPAWDGEAFAALREKVAARLPDQLGKVVRAVVRVLDAERDVQRTLDRLPISPPLRPAREDVARQLGRLVFPGFVSAAGVRRLGDLERYLRAAQQRLGRLQDGVAADAARMALLHELEAEAAATPNAPDDVAWLLEELRVATFAQGLGVRGPVSAKRVRQALRG